MPYRRRPPHHWPIMGYCFTMRQTGFGRMKSFIFLYTWNQKCSIRYPVLHNYYTAWFSFVRLFFFSQVWQNYLFVRKSKSEIFRYIFFSFRYLKQLKINITGQIMVSQLHYSLHTKYIFSSNAIYRYTSRRRNQHCFVMLREDPFVRQLSRNLY
jgi:hypothetical protein